MADTYCRLRSLRTIVQGTATPYLEMRRSDWFSRFRARYHFGALLGLRNTIKCSSTSVFGYARHLFVSHAMGLLSHARTSSPHRTNKGVLYGTYLGSVCKTLLGDVGLVRKPHTSHLCCCRRHQLFCVTSTATITTCVRESRLRY